MFNTASFPLEPQRFLALILLVLISTDLSPAEARASLDSQTCDDMVMSCVKQFATTVSEGKSQSPADICRTLEDFSTCVSDHECLSMEKKEELIANVKASFKSALIDCDVQEDVIFPDTPVEGSVTDVSSSEQVCANERNNCALMFVEKTFQREADSNGSDKESVFCPGLNKYLHCLVGTSCKGEDTGAEVLQIIEERMKQAGIMCDVDVPLTTVQEGHDSTSDDLDDVESVDDSEEVDSEEDVDMGDDDMGDDDRKDNKLDGDMGDDGDKESTDDMGESQEGDSDETAMDEKTMDGDDDDDHVDDESMDEDDDDDDVDDESMDEDDDDDVDDDDTIDGDDDVEDDKIGAEGTDGEEGKEEGDEDEEVIVDDEEGGEKAEANITPPENSALSSLAGISVLSVFLSLVACLAFH